MTIKNTHSTLRVTVGYAKRRVGPGKFSRRAIGIAAAAALTVSSQAFAAVGTWSTLKNAPPKLCNPEALLTDGRILCDAADLTWYTLTPDVVGSYQNGTWSQVASSQTARFLGPSMILNDGRFWIAGGEFVSGTDHGSMEIYDPVANTWTQGPDYPYLDGNGQPVGIYDGAATILSDGRVFCSSYAGLPGPSWQRIAFDYNPVANVWSDTFHGSSGPVTHEQGFTLLPDGTVFTVSGIDGSPAFIYSPTSDTWVQKASPAQPLTVASFNEIGPQLVLHSGKVLVLGEYIANEPATHNNIYDPATGSWANDVPDWPLLQGGVGFGDTAASVMPNGKVLTESWSYALSATVYTEYDPVANAFTPAPLLPAGESTPSNYPAELVLPTGQILVTGQPNMLLYNPSGPADSSSRPIIKSVTLASGRTYTVTGRQLNGLTNGTAEGDDDGLATGYPLVRVTNGISVYYFRTFNFSTMAPSVAGTSQVTQFQFTVPASFQHGAFSLYVVASGVLSRGVRVSF